VLLLLLLLLLLPPPLLTLRDERGGNSPTIWMTSLISVDEEKPSTMAPSGKSVMEESSVISTAAGLVVSIKEADTPAGCSACNTMTASASVLTVVVVVGGGLVLVVEVIGTSVVVVVVVVVASVTVETVLLAAVVLLVVVVLTARPELTLLPLDRILSPICWAWMETLLTSGVFDVRFLLPINQCVNSIIIS
jgi:hypothetical protein